MEGPPTYNPTAIGIFPLLVRGWSAMLTRIIREFLMISLLNRNSQNITNSHLGYLALYLGCLYNYVT